jgi:glycosyltransferase involved in cell wall biosynthesis
MVARNRDGRPLTERLPECTVHRLRPLAFLGRSLNAASMFPAFFNPRWMRKILATATKTKADVLLVRDLPLAPTAIWAGRRLGIPVVLDMAENYPAMIQDIWENDRQAVGDWIVRNPRLVRRVEQWTLERVDHTLVVVEESKARLVRLGVAPGDITIVSNTPPIDRVVTDAPRTEGADSTEAIHVVYLGLLEVPRGIGTLIEAMDRCRQANTNVHLTLIGDGRDRLEFERLARDLGLLDKSIRFLGYVPNAKALKLLQTADVGVIPHYANESWNTTIPNKLFDYMSAGIAVVASSAAPVERIVTETGCGVVFKDRDPEDLARAFRRLRGRELRAQCATAGRNAITARYHWGVDSQRLVNALERLVPARSSQPVEPQVGRAARV